MFEVDDEKALVRQIGPFTLLVFRIYGEWWRGSIWLGPVRDIDTLKVCGMMAWCYRYYAEVLWSR